MLLFKFVYSFTMSSNLRISTTYRSQKHIVLVVMLNMAALIAINIEGLVHNRTKVLFLFEFAVLCLHNFSIYSSFSIFFYETAS